MRMHMKRIVSSVLAVILLFVICLNNAACFADNDELDISDVIYTDVLPGQTVKEAKKLYEDNPAYVCDEYEKEGEYSYRVFVVDDPETAGFPLFGFKGDRAFFLYDKTKGRILGLVVAQLLDGLYGSDVTEIHEILLDRAQEYADFVEDEITDTAEIFISSVIINGKRYSIEVGTIWGIEDSEDGFTHSYIFYWLEPDDQSGNSTASTESTQSTSKGEPTTGEKNALRAANNYLSIMPFSYSGLIRQLMMGDGYSEAEATYAADNCGADWNEQAVRSAENYLSFMSFSRSGLINQLTTGDGYTKEQATYAADKLGL